MADDFVYTLSLIALPINFICQLVIFIGAFYLVIHNRNLPSWHITPLWWVGLCCVLTTITIILQWVFGPEFVMAYRRIGIITETATNVCVAILAGTFLTITIRRDIQGRKQRNSVSSTKPKARSKSGSRSERRA